jgi:hypothetical protein
MVYAEGSEGEVIADAVQFKWTNPLSNSHKKPGFQGRNPVSL